MRFQPWTTAGLLLALSSAPVLAQPSRDIDDYVLFALEHLDFKGRDANPDRGFISGGHVGVNAVDPTDPPEPLMSMGGGGSSHAVVLADNTQVVSDTARLDQDSNLWDLYVNRLVGGSPPVVRSQGPTGFTAPIIATGDLPVLPAINPGANDVVVNSNTLVTIGPGAYREIWVKDDGILVMLAGSYDVRNIRCGRRVVITTYDGTEVRIAEDMHFNNGSYVGVALDVRWLLRSDNVGSNDATVSFGRDTTFHGTVCALNGRINLGHSTDLNGRFWAKRISSDWNVNINRPPDGSTAVYTTTWSRVKGNYR